MNPPLSNPSANQITFPHGSDYPLGRKSRVALVAWMLFLLSGFSLARSLKPDPRGFGTHQRLGLPACSFRMMFTIPCPSCGMTTSFAHFTRGQFRESAGANFAGLLLAIVCAIQIPWCVASAWRGRLWKVSQPNVVAMWLLISFCVISAALWIFRLIAA